LIYDQTRTLTRSNFNGPALQFDFPSTPDFCSDGSNEVNFEVIFGMAQQIGTVKMGYDDMTLYGTCGGSSTTAAIQSATCGPNGPNSDARITLSGFNATDTYQYSEGSTFTAATAQPGSPAPVPAGGVIVSNLPNPLLPKAYTVRVIDASGCTKDLSLTLNPAICVAPCDVPSAVSVGAIAATCTGLMPNNDAQLAITAGGTATRVGYSVGSTYTGPDFATATPLTGGSRTFTGLPNPPGGQVYTIRVYATADCYLDRQVTLAAKDCDPCARIVAEIISSGAADPNSQPRPDDRRRLRHCAGLYRLSVCGSRT
jgi:hypothetical protein